MGEWRTLADPAVTRAGRGSISRIRSRRAVGGRAEGATPNDPVCLRLRYNSAKFVPRGGLARRVHEATLSHDTMPLLSETDHDRALRDPDAAYQRV